MKTLIRSTLLVFLINYGFMAANWSGMPHECRWDLCPYKGILPADYSYAVREYSECDEGSDCYYIDMLHLQFPTDDYDQLEEKLFSNHK